MGQYGYDDCSNNSQWFHDIEGSFAWYCFIDMGDLRSRFLFSYRRYDGLVECCIISLLVRTYAQPVLYQVDLNRFHTIYSLYGIFDSCCTDGTINTIYSIYMLSCHMLSITFIYD